jgi:RecB family endonuclease NucS
MKAPNEKHLEDWIVSRNGSILATPGDNYKVIGRQVRLSAGIADLIVFDGDSLWVYELKKDTIDTHALAQILRYKDDLRQIWRYVCRKQLSDRNDAYRTFPFCVQGLLIGHSASLDVRIAASGAGVSIYLYDFDGENYDCGYAHFPSMTRGTAEEFAYGRIGDAMRLALKAHLAEIEGG